MSSSQSVRSRPSGPAAGTCSRPAPDSAVATIGAFSAPATTIHTSRAAHRAEKPRLTRVGGGFGQPCTATTGRASWAAGDSGKIDAVCPSGPMPSSRTSKGGTSSPSGAAAASSAA